MSYIYLDSVDSTNEYLKRNIDTLSGYTFVTAAYQSKGKGRTGRTWESKKNENVMFSIYVDDREIISKFASVSLLSAYVIFKVLKEEGVSNLSIKWPNDVYADSKKICGILLESESDNDGLKYLIIGCGINVNQESFENVTINTPTSMKIETGKSFDLDDLRKKFYLSFKEELERLKEGTSKYLEVIRENNYLKDKEVYCVYKGEKRLVKVLSIADDNSLVVLLDKQVINIFSDEITFHID